MRVTLACGAMGAWLAWAARGIDWIGLGAGQNLLRAGLVAAVLGAAALIYFAVLGACGVRPRQFLRRG